MPTNKDFKRLVRARMKKTGEAYTTARSHLLQRQATRKHAPATAATDFAALSGTSDAAIKKGTGRAWASWVSLLDQVEAHTWPHRRIAKYVREEHDVPSWWSQGVTVGYERIKGLRVVGQHRDGSFEATKSKTYPVPLARLYQAWSDPRLRAKWLPGVTLKVRSATQEKYMHITWADQTSVSVGFASTTPAKSQVAVQHGKLTDKSAATKMKSYWEERLSALGQVLSLPTKPTRGASRLSRS